MALEKKRNKGEREGNARRAGGKSVVSLYRRHARRLLLNRIKSKKPERERERERETRWNIILSSRN